MSINFDTILESWTKLLPTQLIIRVASDDMRSIPHYQILIIGFDNGFDSPCGLYEIEYRNIAPHGQQTGDQPSPTLEIRRLPGNDIQNALKSHLDQKTKRTFHQNWVTPSPITAIRRFAGKIPTYYRIEEHLNVGAYSHCVALYNLLQMREVFYYPAANNYNLLRSLVIRFGGFIAAERTNMKKVGNMF